MSASLAEAETSTRSLAAAQSSGVVQLQSLRDAHDHDQYDDDHYDACMQWRTLGSVVSATDASGAGSIANLMRDDA